MTTRTSPWTPGVPCWADLSAPDMSAARSFYGAVLGWSFRDTGEEYGGYVIAEVDGKPVAGIGPAQDEQQPPAWTLYLASDDADATAARVSEHGGSVVMAPMDVGSLGRMLIASDPAGGVFGVWSAGEHIGASLVNEPGGITWEDLRSTDPDAARAFYGGVFGYDFQGLEAAGPEYTTFHLPGDPAPLGGMGGMFGAPEGTPSHWLVYFNVPDADTAAEAAGGGGGQVLAPPFDTPFGRMGALVDPAGAVFWLAQPNPEQAMPDRSG
jgi:predicted enzyme related to lactoylglutathione lyase